MTAPIFLLRPLPDAEHLTLDGEEGRHAATVRRLRVGERVDVTDGEGRVAWCVVTGAARDRLELQVERRTEEPEPQPRIVVVQALVKGDRSELAVELLTELGVDEIVVNTIIWDHVARRHLDAGALSPSLGRGGRSGVQAVPSRALAGCGVTCGHSRGAEPLGCS